MYSAISILGAQFITVEYKAPAKEKLKVVLAILVGVALLLLAEFVIYPYLNSLKLFWKDDLYYRVIIVPAGISALLALMIFVKQWDYRSYFIIIPVLLVVVLHPIVQAPSALAFSVQDSKQAFYPFEVFSEKIDYVEGGKVFISAHIFEEKDMLCRDFSACEWMFNVYYDVDVSHIRHSPTPHDVIEDDYTYAFLTAEDWASLKEGNYENVLNTGYSIQEEGTGEIVLLYKENSPSP
jgi:hypothetical protein